MEIATGTRVEVRKGIPPISIQKPALLPKDERPAFPQPARQQKVKRPFFTSTPVLVGSAILLGGILIADIQFKKATKNAIHDARVEEFQMQPFYAGKDSTELEYIVTLSEKYKLGENEMSLIAKIANELKISAGEVLTRVKKNLRQARMTSFDRTVGGMDGDVLKKLDQHPNVKENVLTCIESSDIQ